MRGVRRARQVAAVQVEQGGSADGQGGLLQRWQMLFESIPIQENPDEAVGRELLGNFFHKPQRSWAEFDDLHQASAGAPEAVGLRNEPGAECQ